MKLFNFTAFIISLALGMFVVYVSGARYKTVYVYPTEENIDKHLYMDKASNCFTLEKQEVACPANSKHIKHVRAQ